MIIDSRVNDNIGTVAVIGNYLPRQCGIATFTADLVTSLAAEAPEISTWVVAMNDLAEGYHYPESVRFEIRQNRVGDYKLAADFLNMSQVDAVSVQHEYGIFGGHAGSHILQTLRGLRVPVITTLHTVLRDPDPDQKEVLQELARLSDRLVVMSHKAVEFLVQIYSVPREKVVYVPHGIPDLPFVDPAYYKDQYGVEGRTVLLTFGLLSPGKGLEYMISALPRIVAEFPDVIYVILGATHPHVRREHGEEYRQGLDALARELGVDENVMFHNRFVELPELCEFLGAADLYVTPYLGEAQIVSGTLAYALGAGKAVVSTPYWYAQEMLGEGRGLLSGFRDPEGMADQVLHLLRNDLERHAIRKRAYSFSRNMTWREVARQYLGLFSQARRERSRTPRPVRWRKTEPVSEVLPDVRLEHLRQMTDDVGILQHARFSVPDRQHGYCTEDNARALMVALRAKEFVSDDDFPEAAAVRYLSFLNHAYSETTGRFRNFMTYSRSWVDEEGSDDCQGRAIWALGVTVAEARREWMAWMAMNLFKRALPVVEHLSSPRALAFALLGLEAYLKRFKGDREAGQLHNLVANALHFRFLSHARDDWYWLEEVVTYDNARIPQALLQASRLLERPDMKECGLRALRWLLEIETAPEGHFVPVGNVGWYRRGGGVRARFDQQPLEAAAMIEACLEAHRITDGGHWLKAAQTCFDWFQGRNDLRAPLCDHGTGGCRDGLSSEGANQNQGAEATLSWLLSLLAMLIHAGEGVLGTRSGTAGPEREAPVGRTPEVPVTAVAG